MRTILYGSILLLAAALTAGDASAQNYTSRPYNVACNNGFATLGGPFSLFGMVKEVEVADWRSLTNARLRDQILEQALQEGLATCSGVKAGQIVISGGGRSLVVAWTMLNPRHWTIEKDTVLAEIQREDARIAREQAGQERLKSEALARNAAAEAAGQRKQAALVDCGSSPAISGGPWFSSTYKTGVQHEVEEATRGMFPSFFCVKSVEYLGPAPNPFGGNAARARFTGHDLRDLSTITTERQFPY
jgi:hypothetical protein